MTIPILAVTRIQIFGPDPYRDQTPNGIHGQNMAPRILATVDHINAKLQSARIHDAFVKRADLALRSFDRPFPDGIISLED